MKKTLLLLAMVFAVSVALPAAATPQIAAPGDSMGGGGGGNGNGDG